MVTKKELSEYFAKMGRKGGKKQSAEMTPAERKRRAQMAAKARWAKRRRKGGEE